MSVKAAESDQLGAIQSASNPPWAGRSLHWFHVLLVAIVYMISFGVQERSHTDSNGLLAGARFRFHRRSCRLGRSLLISTYRSQTELKRTPLEPCENYTVSNENERRGGLTKFLISGPVPSALGAATFFFS
jgi:hypothetical protein